MRGYPDRQILAIKHALGNLILLIYKLSDLSKRKWWRGRKKEKKSLKEQLVYFELLSWYSPNLAHSRHWFEAEVAKCLHGSFSGTTCQQRSEILQMFWWLFVKYIIPCSTPFIVGHTAKIPCSIPFIVGHTANFVWKFCQEFNAVAIRESNLNQKKIFFHSKQ